jgi:hypothetical protein
LASVGHLSSVNFSHLNLLLWNVLAKWTETLRQVGGFLQAFQFSPPKKKTDPCWPCFLSNRDEMGNLYRESSMIAQVIVKSNYHTITTTTAPQTWLKTHGP